MEDTMCENFNRKVYCFILGTISRLASTEHNLKELLSLKTFY